MKKSTLKYLYIQQKRNYNNDSIKWQKITFPMWSSNWKPLFFITDKNFDTPCLFQYKS